MKKAAFITIGEAPRVDLADTYDLYFKDDKNVIQVGVLDGLNEKSATELYGAAEDESETLTSCLLNGDAVIMSRDKVERRVQELIEELEEKGFDLISILCTGTFPTLSAKRAELIEPEKKIIPLVKEKYPKGLIGVFVPLKQQLTNSENKWKLGERGRFVAASPYEYEEEVFRKAAFRLAEEGVQRIVLDCMGYNKKMKEVIAEATGLPVIQSNEVLFQYVKEKLR